MGSIRTTVRTGDSRDVFYFSAPYLLPCNRESMKPTLTCVSREECTVTGLTLLYRCGVTSPSTLYIEGTRGLFLLFYSKPLTYCDRDGVDSYGPTPLTYTNFYVIGPQEFPLTVWCTLFDYHTLVL